MRIGSYPWPMPGRRSRLGEGTIMSTIPTARWRIRAPMSSSQPVEPYGLDKPEGSHRTWYRNGGKSNIGDDVIQVGPAGGGASRLRAKS